MTGSTQTPIVLVELPMVVLTLQRVVTRSQPFASLSLTRTVNLLDGRSAKTTGRKAHILRTEALAMEFVRLVTTL